MTPDTMLDTAANLSAKLFMPLRHVTGPLHRRRPHIKEDQNDRLPPLPEPWTDARWFRGGFPPRQHNRLDPLPHGAEYFANLHDCLLSARERVTICGWCLTPLMPLRRDGRVEEAILADVLRQVSEQAEVFVLLWCGAPFLFEPTTNMVENARRQLLEIAPKVRCELDRRAHFSHDHHQKAVTVDGRVAYVGGMDISTFQGDRWDTREHPLRFGPGWHDVQLRLRGEVVRDVEENFFQRWNEVTGDQLRPLEPKPLDPAWTSPAQIVRTVPKGFYRFAPEGEFGIYHALIAAIRQAKRYIYLENQYLWSPEIVEELIEAMERHHADRFRVVVVLPARAYTGKYDNDEHVRKLRNADRGRGLFHAFTPYAAGPAMGPTGYRYLPIYVHAKVSIVDDEWLSVGSANLNGRGLATDTEMNVQCLSPELARALRLELWAEHLGVPVDEIADADPIETIDTLWKRAADELETQLRARAVPPAAQIRLYRPGSNPGSRMLDAIQALTLER